MSWLFSPTHATEVSGLGFVLSVLGTALTLLGLFATYRQAAAAKRSARDAASAVSEFKFRADKYDAFRDLSQASYALEMTKRHLSNDAWRDASDSYEDARKAIIRMQHTVPNLIGSDNKTLTKMANQMANFCNAVEGGLAGKDALPDKFKVAATIRKNYEIIVTLQRSLQDGAH